jgi:hypothetical protein
MYRSAKYPIYFAGLCLVALSAGCGGNGTYSPVLTSATVGISIVSPTPAQCIVGGTLQYQAVVTGTSNTAVNWSVLSQNGGSISSTGLYLAPGTPGTYTVQAQSQADLTKTATATATVIANTGNLTGTVQ